MSYDAARSVNTRVEVNVLRLERRRTTSEEPTQSEAAQRMNLFVWGHPTCRKASIAIVIRPHLTDFPALSPIVGKTSYLVRWRDVGFRTLNRVESRS
jgi:hypothetical protein